jgi:hypothetical protein
MKSLWKVTCQDDLYPGAWQRWFKNQCVAVDWASEEGQGWPTFQVGSCLQDIASPANSLKVSDTQKKGENTLLPPS